MVRRVRLSLVASLFLAALLGSPVLSADPVSGPVAVSPVAVSPVGSASTPGDAMATGGAGDTTASFPVQGSLDGPAAPAGWQDLVAGSRFVAATQIVNRHGAAALVLSLLLVPMLALVAVRFPGVRLRSLLSGAVAGPRAPPVSA
ncbi:hypothetical protein L083_0773 [Actinoplanes sp. N902-109]|nr:hypothetical protein L083_0773 [Actinoplanes sp. N902-109]